jgi:glycogen operon protein
MRRFWRGDGGTIGEFATRLAGSTDVFGNRPLNRGINFIAAHDGFTLADLVTYESKRNEANGEQNRDGTDDNISWNAGDEKTADVKALLATLLLSRGTPMVSMGDELGRTQHGNNNAYAQDNALAWIDWAAADDALIAHTAGLIALRRDLAPLFGGRPLTGAPADGDTEPDVSWHAPDGRIMTTEDWQRHDNRTLIAVLSAGGVTAALVFHAGREPVAVRLPWSETPLSIAARSVTVHKRSQPARGIRGGNDDRVHHLAERAGIQPDWWDVDGGHHAVPLDTKRALLDALRLPSGSATDIRDSLHRLTHKPPLPPALTVRANQPVAVELGVPGPAWLTLRREDGSLERFNTGDGRAVLPPQPAGRHLLLNEDRPERPCRLTVAPAACYLPPDLAAGERRFGIAAHLYALRSAGDRGIGDFTTLTAFARRSAAAGAATIGLNPLHAMFGGNRSRVSPYQPSDRRFIDPVYIDVSVFAGGQGRPPVPGPVDYPGVWAHTRAILRNAFRFDPNEPIAPGLLRFATHEAIAEQHGASWPSWPAALQHPDNPAVAAFAGQHREEIAFHAWMQRVADGQLAAAAADNGLTIGFYRDLAVGAAPDGAEAWSAQDVLMRGVSVGAPPDPFSAQGQVWCLPPPDPVAMRAEGYRGFAELLEANMRHAGALRIDHVMGLRRLFVVPDGASATEGAYIAYPMDDLLGQVALESQKARCLVVGEDLGTVPEGMAEALSASNILSYSVLWFERRDGQIRPPPEWRRLAAACVSTHDLPTLAGWWSGADIAEKQSLGLTDDPGAMTARAQEKQALIAMLQAEGLLDLGISPDGPMPMDFAVAVHRFVAATPSLLTLIQAGDLAGETVAVNLPGTDTERPNWRRRLDPAVDALFDAPLARAILGSMAGRDDRG